MAFKEISQKTFSKTMQRKSLLTIKKLNDTGTEIS